MEHQVDEINKIIHIKCTEEERQKIIIEFSAYTLYGYELNFIIEDKTTN